MFSSGLFDLNPWIVASVLLLGMVLASELGHGVGIRRAKRFSHTGTRVDDAITALFGLLLGFTFAAASARYDRRVVLMTNEATAIASLANTGHLLAEPDRSELLRHVRDYLDDRIEAPHYTSKDKARVELLRRTRANQVAIRESVAHVVQAQRSTTTHVALINGANAILTTFEDAQDALTDHVPVTVYVMLMAVAIATAFCIGRIQGIASDRQPLIMLVYVALIALVIFAILDLEQPRSGIVRIPTDALYRVRATLTL